MSLQGPCDGDAGAPAFLVVNGTRTQVGHAVGSSGASNDGLCGEDIGFMYVDYAPFVGWIHRRISDCGNFPASKRISYEKPINYCNS